MIGNDNELTALLAMMMPGVDLPDRPYDDLHGIALMEAHQGVASNCGPLAVDQLMSTERMDGRSVQRDVVRFMAESVADTIEIAEMRAAELGGTDGPRRTPESDR